MSRSRRQTGAAHARHPAFALVALLAVFLQAFVVQTHFHAPGAPIGVAAAPADSSGASATHASVLDEHQLVGCIVCQAFASGGVAILAATAISVVAPVANEAATYALPRAPPIAAHPWQSRAPPQVLPA